MRTKTFYGGKAAQVGCCKGCGKPQYVSLPAFVDTINIPWGSEPSEINPVEWLREILTPDDAATLPTYLICDDCSNDRHKYQTAMLRAACSWSRHKPDNKAIAELVEYWRVWRG